MRRIFVVLVVTIATASAGTLVFSTLPAPAGAQTPPDDPARGVVHTGLKLADPSGPCQGAFQVVDASKPATAGPLSCTHGPDPAPAGIDVRKRRGPAEVAQSRLATPGGGAAPLPATPSGTAGTAASPALTTPASVQCDGDGTSGYRVQLIFAHTLAAGDRFSQFSAMFAQAASDIDTVYNASAAETGGVRHVRFVTDASCNPVIPDVTLSPTGAQNMSNTETDLTNQGYNLANRRYIVWVDANVYCGIADLYSDDTAAQTNYSNGYTAEFGRIDNGCWDLPGQLIEAHELNHTLGGVQNSAPHSTGHGHCTDDSDRMCYSDAAGVTIQQICGLAHEDRLDCRHDDYYSTAPVPGSYLANFWDTANSRFLITSGPSWSPTFHSPTPADFNGNSLTTQAVYRPSAGTWYWAAVGGGYYYAPYGASGDVPVPGDYDGDGYTDFGLVRPSTSTWFIASPQTGVSISETYGIGSDIPVPGDYDGDSTTDVAVFRPSVGAWYVHRTVDGNDTVTTFGVNGDIPVPGDYDGNHTTDMAVFRPSSGTWYIHHSTGGDTSLAFGQSGDIPVPADYDGDGKIDIAVFRPSTGLWAIHKSSTNTDVFVTYGISTDVPVPGDYSGDGKADIAVFRPASGAWYYRSSSSGTDNIKTFGISTDIPLAIPAAIRKVFYP